MNVRGKQACRLSECCEIFPGKSYSAQPAHKLHSHPLFYLLGFAHQDASDLSRGPDMGSAAGTQVKILDVNQSQMASLFWRQLAQPELARLFERHESNSD